jgi:predicted Zn finger-like uncharacterized protein
MFRVVADQLKLRGGLVRCGQCRTVFDAIGSLAYVEDTTLNGALPEAAATVPAVGRGRMMTAPAPSSPAASPSAPRPVERERQRSDRKRKALGPATTLRIAPGATPVATVSMALPPAPPPMPESVITRAEQAASETGVPTLLATDDGSRSSLSLSDAAVQGIEVIEMAPLPEPATIQEQPEPEFIRAAARRPRRGFSIVFTGGSVMLALLAAAQLAVVFRSDVLTAWPAARPALAQLCNVFGCTLGWPTQPDQLAVISTELQSIAGTDVLELTAVIRNRAPYTQALPALEVTLSDTQNRPVARKVFTPADYLAAAGEARTRIDEGLAAGADMTIRLFFETRGLQAAGFLVYPFYI